MASYVCAFCQCTLSTAKDADVPLCPNCRTPAEHIDHTATITPPDTMIWFNQFDLQRIQYALARYVNEWQMSDPGGRWESLQGKIDRAASLPHRTHGIVTVGIDPRHEIAPPPKQPDIPKRRMRIRK